MAIGDFAYSVRWNLLLISVGSFIFCHCPKAIAEPHGFVPAGLFGVAVLVSQLSGTFGAGLWYMILNVPMFAIGWVFIGRRFLLYSIYAMLFTGIGSTFSRRKLY